jgi:hypothetical protein
MEVVKATVRPSDDGLGGHGPTQGPTAKIRFELAAATCGHLDGGEISMTRCSSRSQYCSRAGLSRS